jgi:glutaconate CoA-transferase subunit A
MRTYETVGPLFTDPDPDNARAFFRTKRVALKEKIMSVSEAVGRFVHDGDYLASGGFGANRIATAALHEVVRQGRKGLGFAGHTTTHDFQILCGGHTGGHKTIARLDAAYVVGLEARGLSPQARRVMERGDLEVSEWSNFALAARFRAGASGLSFIPVRSLLGTDTLTRSGAQVIVCPFTGKPTPVVPALYPDVAFIHVHESDVYGNARIQGISVADTDVARASKRVILTTERIILSDVIRESPELTVIPSLCVDAVCEVPYGSYPGNMAGCYFSDEIHLREWLTVEQDESKHEQFMRKMILDTENFEEYLEVCGARSRMSELESLENGT